MQVKYRLIAFITLCCPPGRFKNWLLRRMGWQIGAGCRAGLSYVSAKRVRLGDGARIGHGNFVTADMLLLKASAYIQHLNRVSGLLWMADAITVGAASCVSRSLDRAGLYVSQPLRYMERDYQKAHDRYPQVNVEGLTERVVIKHSSAKP